MNISPDFAASRCLSLTILEWNGERNIASRYRSGRPLIVTTNLTLEDLQHPEDTAHARIYDRLIEMCSPVRFTGSNFRKATAQEKMGQLKKLMNRKESRL